jgi:hypothetical protein
LPSHEEHVSAYDGNERDGVEDQVVQIRQDHLRNRLGRSRAPRSTRKAVMNGRGNCSLGHALGDLQVKLYHCVR